MSGEIIEKNRVSESVNAVLYTEVIQGDEKITMRKLIDDSGIRTEVIKREKITSNDGTNV